MDPPSVTETCISLAHNITKVSILLTRFVRDVRAARAYLDTVSRELLSLKTVLELLVDDIADSTNESIPDALKNQIYGIVTNCAGVVAEIEQTLKKHESTRVSKVVQWIASGKDDMTKLRSSLEAHKSALDIALDMVTLVTTGRIEANTREIRNDTSAIRQDTAQILAGIAHLQQQLPREPDMSRFMLERYLENLTSYTASICDTLSDDIEVPTGPEAVTECFARCFPHNLDESGALGPSARRVVRLACPSTSCDQNEICVWMCSQCQTPLEYGLSDSYIYCDCGRSMFNNYEFKCKSKSHGPGFSQYDPVVLLSFLKNLTSFSDLNILILGETGVGKSTFINAFANYLVFDTLDESMKAETLNWLVPCSFSMQSIHGSKSDKKIRQIDIKFGARDDELDGSGGRSATQKTVVYRITTGANIIRLIDTPGIGDTRGIDHDRKNIADILLTLRSYKELHGILILLKPNISRLTVPFRYSVEGLLSHLHLNAVRNIAFGFTNTRVSNYMPGDTFKPLSSLLAQYPCIGLGLSVDTMYCFDSESFRFLAAYKNGISVNNIHDFRRSWEHSRAETFRLLDHFRSQPPHQVKSTILLNNTHELILRLRQPMVEIPLLIKTNIALMDDKVREANLAGVDDRMLLETVIQVLKERVNEFKSENRHIHRAIAQLSQLLRKSSITSYNDVMLEYLDFQIKEVRGKVQTEGNKLRLDALEQCRAQYDEIVKILKWDTQQDTTLESLDLGVDCLFKQLYSLKHFGANLQAATWQTLATPDNNRERPYRVKGSGRWQ